MAEIEKTEFEFPDEVEVNARKGGKVVEPESDEPEIEVVDDTPPEDRGRKPMSEPPKEVTDDELSKYDESVQKRINTLQKATTTSVALKNRQHVNEKKHCGLPDLWLKKTTSSRVLLTRIKQLCLNKPRKWWLTSLKLQNDSTKKPMKRVILTLW